MRREDPRGSRSLSLPWWTRGSRSHRQSSLCSPPLANRFRTGTLVPSQQSNSFSRCCRSFCLLPSSILFHLPEVVYLEDMWSGMRSSEFSMVTGGTLNIHDMWCSSSPWTNLRLSRFQDAHINGKGNSLKAHRTSTDSPMLPSAATSRFRNFDPISFWNFHAARSQTGFPSPYDRLAHAQSAIHMEPFPLRGWKFHLNICFCYYQDLHQRPLYPSLCPRFCSSRIAFILIEAWQLPQRVGYGFACFNAIHFSTSWLGRWDFTLVSTNFDFHDYCPTVLLNKHPLWVQG